MADSWCCTGILVLAGTHSLSMYNEICVKESEIFATLVWKLETNFVKSFLLSDSYLFIRVWNCSKM